MFATVIIVLFVNSHYSYALSSSSTSVAYDLWVNEDHPFQFCCQLTLRADEALILSSNGTRIKALRKTSEIVGVQGDQVFWENNPGWKLDEDNPEKLCLVKSSGANIASDHDRKFLCQTFSAGGLGPQLRTESIILKINRAVKIMSQPEMVEVEANSTTVILCIATGFPNLRLFWRSVETKEILAQSEHDPKATQMTLNLTLPSVRQEQHNNHYVCDAGAGMKSSPPVENVTKLSVLLRPKITMPQTIYTHLGNDVLVQVTVTGYPTPVLSCDGKLTLSKPSQLADYPQGGIFQYTIGKSQVTEGDLKAYKCVAANKLGTDEVQIELSVGPSVPVILSPNVSNHADYYLLKWQTNSELSLKNVTVRLLTYNETNSIQPTISNIRTFTVQLDNENDKSIAHKEVSTALDPWQRVILQHIANLTDQALYGITLNVCNSYACKMSYVEPKHNATIMFRTLEFDGKNKVKQEILDQSPTETTPEPNIPSPSGIEGVRKRNRANSCSVSHALLLTAIPFYLISLNV